MFKRRLFFWIALITACLLMGFLEGFRSYINAYRHGQFWLEWKMALWWDIIGWSSWIFLAPLTIWLSRRFRPESDNRLRNISALFFAGIVVSFIRAFFTSVIYTLVYERSNLAFMLSEKPYVFITDFFTAFFVYSLVLAIENAINYYKQFRESELRKSQLETKLAQAQLQALKTQLHPHFLFNALNSISALQLEDVKAAQKMTARLGDFLRMTLENVGAQEVTLKQEMEFLKCYLEIERTRFSNRLTSEIKLEPDTLDALVPNLILQPIVENSIRHGISNRITSGHITVSANRNNGNLHIEVKDNGTGLKMNGTNRFQEGFGLSNTQARLKKHYGANYRFNLEMQTKA